MAHWNFICLALFSALVLTSAQFKTSVEKSSASDEIGTSDWQMSKGGGRRLRLENGVEKIEECMGGLIMRKVCDPDNLLSHSEKDLIKGALRELEDFHGIKLTVLLLKNIKDPKETDLKVFEMVKHHANSQPLDRVGVLVFSIGSDFKEQNRQSMLTDRLLNTPIYYYFPVGVWSNFYSTSTVNTMVQPSDIVQLYNKEAPLLHEGTYGVALLDIIHGIRDKALIKQGKGMTVESQFQQTQSLLPKQMLFGTDDIFKVERCLLQFEGKVCDPDGMLHTGEKERIDSALNSLEEGTVEFSQIQTGRWAACKKGGIKLATIIIKDVQNQEVVDKKINDMLYQWSLAHPCDRTAVMMLSPSQQTTRFGDRFQTVGGQQPYYYRYPIGVWSKFYGISNLNVPVTSQEIVQLYDQVKPLIRQGEYAEALLDIIRGFKERAQSRRFTRQTDSFRNIEEQGFFKKEFVMNALDECLLEIKPKVCDPENLLTGYERETIQNTLKQIERETERESEIEDWKKKGFVVTVVMFPFIDDITDFEKKINDRLQSWRLEHLNQRVAIVMLSTSKGDVYGRSKFYGTSTRDAPVRPHELVQFYNANKLLIRSGKHGDALLSMVEKIHERAQGL